jgi:RNA polymerase sigma factor (sigma-70 family)
MRDASSRARKLPCPTQEPEVPSIDTDAAGYRFGDNRDLTAIYVRYAGEVYGTLRKGFYLRKSCARTTRWIVGSQSRAEIDDLVQEVFARAFSPRSRSSFDEARAVGPYLIAIAQNVYLDHLRKRKAGAAQLDNVAIDTLGGRAPSLTNPLGTHFHHPPEEMFHRDERVKLLADFVERLPADLRGLYETRFVRGLSQRDAAVVLRLSRRRIRTLENRLLASAARELGFWRQGGNSKKKRPKFDAPT